MKVAKHRVVMSPTLRHLLIDCQTWCTADCCKEKAFQFSESAVMRWLAFQRIDRSREIAKEIGKLGADLQPAEGQVYLAARGLESIWDLEAFRVFWERLEVVFTSAVEARHR